MTSHARCAENIGLVCPVAFDTGQVQAAFVRCFASLLYTYRKYLHPATADQRKNGKLYRFNMEGFTRSMPRENAHYVQILQQTQGTFQPGRGPSSIPRIIIIITSRGTTGHDRAWPGMTEG